MKHFYNNTFRMVFPHDQPHIEHSTHAVTISISHSTSSEIQENSSIIDAKFRGEDSPNNNKIGAENK